MKLPNNPTRTLATLIWVAATCFSGIAHADRLNCPCKVVKVSDGDTVHLVDQARERHKIRLGGIDAPESKQIFGKQATQNLTKFIAGRNVEVEYDKRDRYGRIIGKLIKEGQDINLQQVKDGFAWHYKRYQNEQTDLDQILYDSAENAARKRKIGLWAAPSVPPWEYRQAKYR